MKPDANVWGSLLFSCRFHDNADLGDMKLLWIFWFGCWFNFRNAKYILLFGAMGQESWNRELGILPHIKTSRKYPWLMLYLRADATQGYSGGYHYETRGMMKQLPGSPNFKVRLTLNITKGGGAKSLFYLTNIGSCWKNDRRPCDGDVETDVTIYSEVIINPKITNWWKQGNLSHFPP